VFAHDVMYYPDVRKSLSKSEYDICVATYLTFDVEDGIYDFEDGEGFFVQKQGTITMHTFDIDALT